MLTPDDDELQQIADMGLAAGILERRLDVRELVDRRFIPERIEAAAIAVDASGRAVN
jgi:NitT/TauT family transport system substrate-binding protein